jgi:vanillate monooxygenase ferredoxin subunit
MIDDTLRPVIVAKKTNEAHNMVSFELADLNGAELPAFSADSHIDVTIPGGLVRQYSLCNSSAERNRCHWRMERWQQPGRIQGASRTGQ